MRKKGARSAFTAQQLQQILNERAQEGLYLEFKRGAALASTNEARLELIKDCTGFANASGGTILYGVAEEQVENINVAAALSPVSPQGVGGDWITNIIRSNTSPPLSRFEITELPVSEGRVVVIEIEASSTAHQSLIDRKYYQRAGRTTEPMVDFQIRDVMNRRLRPEILVGHRLINIESNGDLHRKALEVFVTNVGRVTLEKWYFEIDIPPEIVRDTRDPNTRPLLEALVENWEDSMSLAHDAGGRRVFRIGRGDPDEEQRRRFLHPGQTLALIDPSKHPEIVIEVDHDNWRRVGGQSISWRMYLPDLQPIQGDWPFDDWCHF